MKTILSSRLKKNPKASPNPSRFHPFLPFLGYRNIDGKQVPNFNEYGYNIFLYAQRLLAKVNLITALATVNIARWVVD